MPASTRATQRHDRVVIVVQQAPTIMLVSIAIQQQHSTTLLCSLWCSKHPPSCLSPLRASTNTSPYCCAHCGAATTHHHPCFHCRPSATQHQTAVFIVVHACPKCGTITTNRHCCLCCEPLRCWPATTILFLGFSGPGSSASNQQLQYDCCVSPGCGSSSSLRVVP